MQNDQQLYLRNTCTCVAWAQILYIINKCEILKKNYVTKSDSLPSAFIPYTIDISELLTE